MRTWATGLFVLAVPMAAAGSEPHVDAAALEADVRWLADDALDGRGSGAAGGLAARELLIDELVTIGPGLNEGAPERAAYVQPFDEVRANVLAVIPGALGPLQDEYVVIGAHYDHFPSDDCHEVAGDSICNGATDDAAGVAVVLAIGRAIAAQPTPPSRSIVLAFWDGEERGLLGSNYFTDHPLVPLEDVVANVNFDIQGANLAPHVRDTSFAIGAESGGDVLTTIVADAIAAVGLGTKPLSVTFGQGRSDYHPFWSKSVPIVFFSDATNACYHTANDEIAIVDFGKLARQAEIGFRVVQALAESADRPSFVPLAALDTYDDLVVLSDFLTSALADLDVLYPSGQEDLLYYEELARTRVEAGPEAFSGTDALTIAQGAITIATTGLPCDPQLLPEPAASALGACALLALAATAARSRRRDGRDRSRPARGSRRRSRASPRCAGPAG
jgi:Peptidase family M28